MSGYRPACIQAAIYHAFAIGIMFGNVIFLLWRAVLATIGMIGIGWLAGGASIHWLYEWEEKERRKSNDR